jgi:Rab GDP dissociation inhibitor
MAVCKIPTNQSEILASGLMGLWEKKNMAGFLKFITTVTEDPKTWNKYDLANMPLKDLYKKYGIGEAVSDFLGHAVALEPTDAHLHEPALPAILKMNLYLESHGRYGDSPFLYPLYGIGGLPEAFSRLCAIHGGTYMLNTQVDEILMADGKVTGIKSGD